VFQGDPHAAREVLKSVAKRHRPDGRLLREWAGIEKRLGDLSAAAALYKRASDADPRDERTWLQWGLLERRRGEVDAALKCWRAGLKVSPLNPFLWQLCGVTLWDAGRVVTARETFTQGLKFCPTSQPLLLEWALKEAEGGDERAALEILRLSQAAQGAPHAPLLAAWVQLATRLGYTEEAVQIAAKLKDATSDGGKAAALRKKKRQQRTKYFAAKSRGTGTVSHAMGGKEQEDVE
jgi:pre-mRNA-processing factor 6